MNEYLYEHSRNSAWQFLVRVGARQFPVKLAPICNSLHIRLRSYQTTSNLLERMGLSKLMTETEGFIYYANREYTIFYDASRPVLEQRVTLAHELGHIALGHIEQGAFMLENRMSMEENPLDEEAADAFAARLLAPACVLHFARITTAEQIEQTCQITSEFAQYRAQRLANLEERNAALLEEQSNGYFFRNKLEEDVYRQFKDYIKLVTNQDSPKEAL